MSLTTSEMTPADFAAINGNDGWGGNGLWWLVILFLLCGNNGFGGNNGQMPYFYNAQTQDVVARGFDNAAIAGLNATINNGFSDVALSQATQTTNLLQSMNGLAMSLQNCCCENRSGLADVKYTVATENCADRQALNEGVRDIIASNTANTQAILDKLCAQEIAQKDDLISQLRQELLYSKGQASQTAQTAELLADNLRQTSMLEQYLNPAPVPAYVVANPNCCTNTCGCGV